MRTHIVIPEEIVYSVDKLVGPRNRSSFFVNAAKEKLTKLKLTKMAKKVAGSLADTDIPGWETSKSSTEWVKSSRLTDEDEKISG